MTRPAATLPTWRDPWAWASALAVVPLVVKAVGARLGEPAAEDFDMLHRALFEPTHTLLDGGGTNAFWRPVSFQLYFDAVGRALLARPAAVAFLHACLLGLAAVLLYRAFRPRLSGPVAAAAASFPLLAESTRVLLAWPSQFGDLAALLFSALALHEAARRRMPTALTALALALLSKEVAVVTALLLPFLPGVAGAPGGRPGERARWMAGAGLVLVAWAGAYAWVRVHAGLELPHGLERSPALLHTSLATRLAWAWGHSVQAVMSSSAHPLPGDVRFVPIVLVPFTLAGALLLALDPRRRKALRADLPWIAWGLAWFLLAAGSLAPIYPLWAPVRSAFAAVGAGVALVLFLRAANPGLAALFVLARVLAVLFSPGPPSTISPEPPDRGAFVDFPRIARLQLLMHDCRAALEARYPRLPHGAMVGFRNLPLSTEYAFGGAHAVQAWYGDPSLRWLTYADFQAHPDTAVVALFDYQPNAAPQIALLDPGALRAQRQGVTLLEQGQWAEALAAFDRAEAAQADTHAVVFLGDNAGRRAYCLAQLDRFPEAEREARRALAAAAEDGGARFVLAAALAVRGERAQAVAELDTLLAQSPHDEDAKTLRARLLARARGAH